jgi:aminopeptidase N
LHAAAQKEKTSLVKDNLYSLLSSSSSASLARRALDLSLTAEPGATNSAEMIARVAELHPDLAFDFALAHMNAVNEKVDVTSRSSYYPALATLSIDPAMIEKVKAYADANVAASSRRTAETAMARITYRIKVRNERLPAIDVWLARSSG